MDPEKRQKIHNWPRPQNVSEMRSFLGYATSSIKFIKGFAALARTLKKIMQNVELYAWHDGFEQYFNALKEHFEKAVVVNCQDFSKQFILDTDASDTGIGAVLSQFDASNKERPIALNSGTMAKAVRR